MQIEAHVNPAKNRLSHWLEYFCQKTNSRFRAPGMIEASGGVH